MFEKITKDLTEAMKAKDTFRTSVLRMLKSALKNEEIKILIPLIAIIETTAGLK